MNALDLMSQTNYYTNIKGVEVLVDNINERLKILVDSHLSGSVVADITSFARAAGLGKVIANCRSKHLLSFKNCGFQLEGMINGYFKGEDAYCISFFIDRQRAVPADQAAANTILHRCVVEHKRIAGRRCHPYTIRNAEQADIPQMIQLFASVFATYPSPVFSSDYLHKVINAQVLFKVAVEEGQIISIASADMDKFNLVAEITDCATYPEHRGRGILPNLILELEHDLQRTGFLNLYSLSRAINPGINQAFAKLGYTYRGRLVNNCHICGSFEDMNIWVKSINPGGIQCKTRLVTVQVEL
ncbi:MAG: N-acetyltransferase YodP [Pelotomaculum sp. PtaB.Bin104]|nr:MAG: N-acetyltransferase YodP [Pelotomaculum sp. PtaB.Bin104]